MQELTLPPEKLAAKLLIELDANEEYELDNFVLSGTAGIGRLDVQAYLYDSRKDLKQITTTVIFTTVPLGDKSLRYWVAENGFDDLLGEPDEQQVIFEPLRRLWPFIRDRSPADAKNWIHQELLRSSDLNKLTVLGFSISETQAAIITPALLLGLLVSLGMTARHAGSLQSKDAEQMLCEFPWMGLYPGTAGGLSVAVVVVLLPVWGVGLLLTRVSGPFNWIAWPLFAVLVATAGWTWMELRVVRLRASRLKLQPGPGGVTIVAAPAAD